MKRVKYLLFVFLLRTFFGFGQESKITFGGKVGVNFSQYTPDLEMIWSILLKLSTQTRLFFWAYTNFLVNNKFKLRLELFYSLQGTSRVADNVNVVDAIGSTVGVIREFRTNINESTLQLPLIVQHQFVEKIFLEGEIQVGLYI